jgi:steroid delta-isomerase-like uncharacterized protein
MIEKTTPENAIPGLTTELLAAWNSQDLDRIVGFYSPDYRDTDVAWIAPRRGLEGVRQMMAMYFKAFPDLYFTAESTLIQGEQIALFWRAQGTHQGKVMNIPPTGRPIDVRGASLLTLTGGKISRAQYVWDVAGLLRQLGLLPELSETG